MKKGILLILFIVVSTLGVAQTGENCLTFSYEETIKEIPDLNEVNKYNVFFLGETHNVGGNDLMDYSLLTYLNKTQDLTHFIKEGTYSYNFLLSKYIETADRYYLELLGDDFSVAEEKEFLERLVEYNKTVALEQRIKLYGIDSEPFYHLSIMVDALEYTHGTPPEPVAKVFDLLKSFKTEEWTLFISRKAKKEIKKVWKRIEPILSENQILFKEYLGEDFIHLKMVLDNPATLKRSDNKLLENFFKLQKLTAENTFYFSYGSLHAQKKGSWLANKINKSSQQEDKVLSIKTVYSNSTFFWGKEELPLNTLKDYKEEDRKKILGSFDDCSTNYSLISSKNTVYEKEFDLLLLTKNQKGTTIEKR